METVPAGNLLAYLQQIPDPRGRQGRRHDLSAMLATVVCALLCGCRGYAAIAQWIHTQEREVWYLLGFFRKPPTRNAFRNLLLALPPETLEQAIRLWTADVLPESLPDEPLRAVAIDGKSLCGTLATHGRTVHLLSLFDQQTGCVLNQLAVDTKTNEQKAALPLLKSLVLEGHVITGDAMFCQREICQQVTDDGGHYFFVVKDNQPTLKEAIEAEFQAAFPPYAEKQRLAALDEVCTHGKEHGRVVTRRLESSSRLATQYDWPALAQVCRLTRTTKHRGKQNSWIGCASARRIRSAGKAFGCCGFTATGRRNATPARELGPWIAPPSN